MKKHFKLLTLIGLFTCLLFLSAKTFAQPYARIEQSNFHMYDSTAPYGVTCDTKLALYWEDYCGNPYSAMGGTFPTNGFDVIVSTETEYSSPNANIPWNLGNIHYAMTSDTYTIATYSGSYVSYNYQDMWGQNQESWLVFFNVINNTGTGARASYTAATTYPTPYNY